jgi:hypothetical protein
MEWPAIFGAYGAVVATLTAAWSIRSGLRDRGRLKLELELKRFVQNAASGEMIEMSADSLEGLELHLIAVNVGRRSIAVAAWYGIPRRRSHGAGDITFGEAMSRRPLNETEQCSMVSRNFVEAFTSGLHRMYVTDSSGRRWNVPRNCLRTTAKRIEQLHSVPPGSRLAA